MKIIESYIEGKSSQLECEDALFINDNFIAVIDGATSKGELLWNGKKSGVYAKEIVSSQLEIMDKKIDAYTAIEQINNAIKHAYGDKYIIAKEKVEERIVANIIIYSITKKEIWIFGDCQCLINGKFIDNSKETDKILSQVRSLYINTELLKGEKTENILKTDKGREYILPLLKNSMLYANRSDLEYGYDTLDGFEINPKNCIIIKVKQNDEIVLASDGYPALKTTLEESEEYLKYVIEKDPLCINIFKSTKGIKKGNNSFDDRTYIKFIV